MRIHFVLPSGHDLYFERSSHPSISSEISDWESKIHTLITNRTHSVFSHRSVYNCKEFSSVVHAHQEWNTAYAKTRCLSKCNLCVLLKVKITSKFNLICDQFCKVIMACAIRYSVFAAPINGTGSVHRERSILER